MSAHVAAVDAAIADVARALANLTQLRRSLGGALPVEERAGSSPHTGARPPDRPPERRKRGPPKTGAERTAKWRAELEAKKRGEQGASPTPPDVDSPEQTHSDSHPYTAQEAASSAHVAQTTALGGVSLATRCDETRDETSPAVTSHVTKVTSQTSQGEFKGVDFSVAVASKKPSNDPHPSPPFKAPPLPSPEPSVTSRRAPRVLAAHTVRARGEPRSRDEKRDGDGDARNVTAVTVTGPTGGESALTPDGRVAPGFSLHDALCEVFRAARRYAYNWTERDSKALRALLGMADEDEIIMRWRFSMRATHPPCNGLDALLKRWNEFGAPLPERSTPRPVQSEPPTQHHVGRSTAQECICAVHGCGDPGVPAWGQSLCIVHFDEMARDVGSLSNTAAAAWLEGQNAVEVAS